ncbi:MAG TPA: c-type cytochrome biogenesis protein CcsB [Deltaproteobacteria bacterium]|nr:c-type cytochrome biogenesis protein CcsB [Deltaproteobacteria bacterium]
MVLCYKKAMTGYEDILSRDVYLLLVEVRLYWLVAMLYGTCFLLFLFHVITKERGLGRAARALLWAAVVIHAGQILLRTFEGARAPFQTLYESLSWFAWTASLTYLYASRRWRDFFVPGLFVTPLSMGACLYALLSRSPAVEPLSPPLQSYWFEWHVILAFFSYAVFVVSCAVEASYLVMKPFLRRGLGMKLGMKLEDLDAFRSMAVKLVVFGFPALTFAIFSGAAWANEAWGRYWSWDPKETWSLITWTVFTMYLHAMAVPAWRGAPASALNVLGFLCMMMTFLGVNWLAKLLGIPSLHLYAV